MTARWNGATTGHGRYLVRHDDAITSRCLGPVQGGVGGLQHRLSALAVIGKYRDARGQGDGTNAPPVGFDPKVLHAQAYFFGTLQHRSGRGVCHDQRELLATVPAQDVLAARERQHVLSHRAQYRVTRRVAEHVVAALEMIYVDHHYAERLAAAPGAALFAIQ